MVSAPERVGLGSDPHAATPHAHATPAHLGQVSIEPLERALFLAEEAGRFDVLAKLADELHARRGEMQRLVSLDAGRRRRDRRRK